MECSNSLFPAHSLPWWLFILLFDFFFKRLYHYQSKEDEQIAPGSRDDRYTNNQFTFGETYIMHGPVSTAFVLIVSFIGDYNMAKAKNDEQTSPHRGNREYGCEQIHLE